MKTSPPRPRSAGKPRKTSPGFAVAPAGQSRKPEKTRRTIPASALRKTGPLVFLGFRDVPKVNVSRGKPPVSGFLNQAGCLIYSLVFWFSDSGFCAAVGVGKPRSSPWFSGFHDTAVALGSSFGKPGKTSSSVFVCSVDNRKTRENQTTKAAARFWGPENQ